MVREQPRLYANEQACKQATIPNGAANRETNNKPTEKSTHTYSKYYLLALIISKRATHFNKSSIEEKFRQTNDGKR